MEESSDHFEENIPDYIDCLEQVIERDKCKDCTDFECNITERNMCISATLNDLKVELKKMLY